MADVSGTRRDRRKRRTAAAILEAAESLIAERGDAGTIDQVAERADVAVGSVYNHFGSRDGLLMVLAERAFEANAQAMNAAYERRGTAVEQITAAANEFARFHQRHPELFRLLAFPPAPGGAAGRAVAARIAERVDRQNARLIDALERAIAAGDVRPIDSRRTATVLWAAWCGLIALRWRPDSLQVSEEELRRLLDVAADIVANGLSTDAAKGS